MWPPNTRRAADSLIAFGSSLAADALAVRRRKSHLGCSSPVCAWLGCASSQPLVPFTPSFPRNYLIVHSGQATEFRKADCVVIETVHDTDRASMLRLVCGNCCGREFRAAVPWKEPYMLVVSEYEGGRGVCIDCRHES